MALETFRRTIPRRCRSSCRVMVRGTARRCHGRRRALY
jgi:hypothetical protein